jgi:iron complex outermembrane receptor protein
MRNRMVPGLFFFMCAQPVIAAGDPGLPFAEADDIPMVLSATRLNQSFFDVPAAVTVIDRQMIEQSGVREIPELLRMVPGMVVGYESGSEAFVSYHGTSADLARRMQVLVDGRSIYQPLLASVDWIGLPLDLADIERIEVIRGPNAATYGVNSFFAVVNIITRHPADVAGSKISYRRGENGIEDYHARFAQRAGKVDWRLSVAGRADDGFVDNHRKNDIDFTDSKNTDSVYGRAVWAIDDNSSLELSLGRAQMVAQQQYRETDIFLKVPEAEKENRYASLAWDTDLSERHQFRIQANHSRFSRAEPWLVGIPPIVLDQNLGTLYKINRDCAKHLIYEVESTDPRRDTDDNNDGIPDACNLASPEQLALLQSIGLAAATDPEFTEARVFIAPNRATESRTEVDIQDTWVFSPNFRSVFGLSYDKSVATSDTYIDGREENVVWGLFAHAEWQLSSQLLLNVGGGQEFDRDAGDYFSPRAALNWQFMDDHVIRLVYSEGVRTPDILETSADWGLTAVDVLDPDSGYGGTYFETGQSDDAPTETISSSEIGYFARFAGINVTTDVRLFQDRVELAEHDISFEDFAIKPLEFFKMRGAELAVDWRPLPSQRLQLNYAHLDMTGPLSNDNTNFVPKHSGSLGWWQEYNQGWQVGTTYYFYNDLRNSNQKSRQFYFDRVDARLARKVELPGRQVLEVAAVIQCRLTGQPELREENVAKRHVGWLSLDWRY